MKPELQVPVPSSRGSSAQAAATDSEAWPLRPPGRSPAGRSVVGKCWQSPGPPLRGKCVTVAQAGCGPQHNRRLGLGCLRTRCRFGKPECHCAVTRQLPEVWLSRCGSEQWPPPPEGCLGRWPGPGAAAMIRSKRLARLPVPLCAVRACLRPDEWLIAPWPGLHGDSAMLPVSDLEAWQCTASLPVSDLEPEPDCRGA